ncbi:MAG: glycosyltransferase family 2 protein [Spirochaetales bacterium]|nr:glycosyltransferase family 2 protein [Spirochaetales bacterium]
MNKEIISFVIPCYNSTNTISAVVDEIKDMMVSSLGDYGYEIILVNDCSPDGTTYNKITELAEKDKHIKGLNLARNFGQPSAVMAGLHYAKGNYIVCGDDDGQTPFNEFPKLFEKIREGYDIVEAKYAVREKRSLFRKLGTFANETMATSLISKPKGLELTSFWCIRRFVADDMLKYENPYPYLGGLMLRVSRNACNVSVSHRQRLSGKSGYSLSKMINLWLNGFTNFSIKPLRFATISGAIIAFLGFCYGIWTIINKLLHPKVPAGYASTLAIMVFLFGFSFLFLGLIGEYVGRIYISLNRQPQFIIKEKINVDSE